MLIIIQAMYQFDFKGSQCIDISQNLKTNIITTISQYHDDPSLQSAIEIIFEYICNIVKQNMYD